MKAGRELDLLVARKVMDWDGTWGVVEHSPPEYSSENVKSLIKQGLLVFSPRHYSTDISAAFEVLAVIKTWTFSERLAFQRALAEVISERLEIIDGLIAPSEIILHVEASDISLAALNTSLPFKKDS